MARLAQFTVDAKAIEDGQWVKPGEEFDDLEIRTRGFTDAYFDAQAARLRRAALSLGGDVAKIPNAIQKAIRVECLIKHVVQDVRHLEGADGPIDFAAFCELLRDPNYGDLVVAVVKAASQVGRVTQAEASDAVGN